MCLLNPELRADGMVGLVAATISAYFLLIVIPRIVAAILAMPSLFIHKANRSIFHRVFNVIFALLYPLVILGVIITSLLIEKK